MHDLGALLDRHVYDRFNNSCSDGGGGAAFSREPREIPFPLVRDYFVSLVAAAATATATATTVTDNFCFIPRRR